MYNNINEDRMTIYLEDDLIAPNVKGFNISVIDYLDEIDEIDEVILNLQSVDNIDSIGVTFVIGLYKTVTKEGLGFVISEASTNVKQLFKLMKLEDLLE